MPMQCVPIPFATATINRREVGYSRKGWNSLLYKKKREFWVVVDGGYHCCHAKRRCSRRMKCYHRIDGGGGRTRHWPWIKHFYDEKNQHKNESTSKICIHSSLIQHFFLLLLLLFGILWTRERTMLCTRYGISSLLLTLTYRMLNI